MLLWKDLQPTMSWAADRSRIFLIMPSLSFLPPMTQWSLCFSHIIDQQFFLIILLKVLFSDLGNFQFRQKSSIQFNLVRFIWNFIKILMSLLTFVNIPTSRICMESFLRIRTIMKRFAKQVNFDYNKVTILVLFYEPF